MADLQSSEPDGLCDRIFTVATASIGQPEQARLLEPGRFKQPVHRLVVALQSPVRQDVLHPNAAFC